MIIGSQLETSLVFIAGMFWIASYLLVIAGTTMHGTALRDREK